MRTIPLGVLDATLALGQNCDHNPTAAPFARDVKFTENAQRLELGDGFRNTMSGKGVRSTQRAIRTGLRAHRLGVE